MKADRVFVGFVVALFLTCSSASSSVAEHWSCGDGWRKQEWILIENRMFAPKGKESLTLAVNSATVAVAHFLFKTPRGEIVSWVYVLDKVGKRIIEYDDSTAVIFKGTFGQPLEPGVTETSCKRDDK